PRSGARVRQLRDALHLDSGFDDNLCGRVQVFRTDGTFVRSITRPGVNAVGGPTRFAFGLDGPFFLCRNPMPAPRWCRTP
ncbi:MAG: hypothetical protein KC442_16700, partial [Thermomicrobiales bacterium]|nr:hypothetical protein [Thermomicrobiales bacterium]